MLKESRIHQIPKEKPRRLFSDAVLDLFVWYDDAGAPHGFQLLYRIPDYPFLSVMWTPKEGWRHFSLIGGERGSEGHDTGTGMAFMDPVHFDKDRVLEAFAASAASLDPALRDFVSRTLAGHPDRMLVCPRCSERRAAACLCPLCDAVVCRKCAHRLADEACPRTKPNRGWFAKPNCHSWHEHF